MKKLLLIILLIISSTGAVFADRVLTIGEALTMYFTELFPESNPDTNDVMVKYSGIGTRSGLRSALQRAVYYGMLPNDTTEIKPDKPMTDRAFLGLLKRHFGIRVTTDASTLTKEDYDRYMTMVRPSVAYRLFQSLNTSSTITNTTESLPVESRFTSVDNYYLVEKVYNILKENYINADKLDKSNLVYGATEGMVKELGDAYTVYFRPEASTDFNNVLNSNIVGIGVVIDVDSSGALLVTDVIRHSPADTAGITAGDKIVKIDNFLVDTADGITDEITRLRGKQGTSVEVGIISGKVSRILTVARDVIHVKEVDTEVLDNAFHLIFGEVSFGSDLLIKDALQSFLASGKKRLILDLRNNPGGSMGETKNILNYFIAKGNPLTMIKYPKQDSISFATEKPLADWSQYEIVILVNKDTASAAEIIALTLKEYFPTTVHILGETTYGKGTVQELISFDDKSLLKYTIAKWFTAKNKVSIDGVGITPDKSVVFDRNLWRTKRIDTQLLMGEKYEFAK